jgi:hypothetical protein
VIDLTGATAKTARPDGLWLEVLFDFLGTTVRVLSMNVEQLQHWCAVYGEFRVPHREADVTIRVNDPTPSTFPRGVTIEDGERICLWDGREPLMPPLRQGRLSHWLYIQAAAVGRNGHSALLVGGRRTGKTTLAIACAARGARLIADDMVPLDPDVLLALPWPKSLALPSSALEAIGLDPSRPGLVPFETRAGELLWRVPPSTLFGRQVSREANDVAALVFLEPPGRTPPGLMELPSGEAFERLVRHLEVRPADGAAAADALIRLCRQAPAYTLSCDPADGAALVDEFLR